MWQTTSSETKRLLLRGDYRVIVLDLILPDGTGSDILDFIKSQKLPSLPIVVITAAEPSLLVRLDRAMVKSVMFKPLDTAHLVDVICALAFDRSIPAR